MKPDRSDYEIWLIDWLDGKLDQNRVDELMLFLDENPDIKEEAELFAQLKLNPVQAEFSNKQNLKKDINQIPSSQIEYLSVASLENDITESQRRELEENLNRNPENRKIFDTISRIKLIPDSNIKFINKKLLYRRTPFNEVIKLPSVWMSAAAVIALVIISYFLVPRINDSVNETLVSVVNPDSLKSGSEPVINNVVNEPLAMKEIPVKEEVVSFEAVDQAIDPGLQPISTKEVNTTEQMISRVETEIISSVPVMKPSLPLSNYNNPLLIAAQIKVSSVMMDDDRSKLEKFIARNFRDKILNEDLPTDAPLKNYEIAEAGIEGLNKLLGWEMTLVKNNDDEGDVQSVSFNSKLLKFNTPVKSEGSPVTF